MKDQNSIDVPETPSQKYERALDLFTESVLKPDHDLRGCAHNQGCYDELMEIREHVINYLAYSWIEQGIKIEESLDCLLYTSPSPRD